jgi:hypothetical protein
MHRPSLFTVCRRSAILVPDLKNASRREKKSMIQSRDNLLLVSPCGYCCLSCPSYENSTCTDELAIEKEALRAGQTVATFDRICRGCRPTQGRPFSETPCETYTCCTERGYDFCHECPDFPCLKLAPVSERAEVRRHNTKIYSLLMLRRLGLEEYIRRSGDISRQWVRGTTPVPGSDVRLRE